jgi:predicted N-acetyltransferase YhbS
MIKEKLLSRNEIRNIWEIDRSEVIKGIYYLRNGKLVLEPEHYDLKGWPSDEEEKYYPILEECFDRGGWFYGLFQRNKMIGAVVLDNKFITFNNNYLQLKFLHISHNYRGKGLGRKLFELASNEARKRQAKYLYISATPSENRINFYLRLGCKIMSVPDKDLFQLEPEDIHLEYDLRQ